MPTPTLRPNRQPARENVPDNADYRRSGFWGKSSRPELAMLSGFPEGYQAVDEGAVRKPNRLLGFFRGFRRTISGFSGLYFQGLDPRGCTDGALPCFAILRKVLALVFSTLVASTVSR